MAKRLKKTTVLQYEELLAFLENNESSFLTGKINPLNAKVVNRLWEDFAKEINRKDIGPAKTALQWKTIYIEWKRNTKRKSRIFKQIMTRTGGRTNTLRPLNNLEERLLTLISKNHSSDYDDTPETIGTHKNETLVNAVGIVENILSNPFQEDPQSESLMTSEDLIEITPVPAELEFVDLDLEGNSAGSSEPSTSNASPRAPGKHFNHTPTSCSKKISGYYVDSATHAYQEVQNRKIKAAQENAAAINNLSLSINKLAESLANYGKATELQAEANLVKAKTEMLNAKLNMYKHLETHCEGEL